MQVTEDPDVNRNLHNFLKDVGSFSLMGLELGDLVGTACGPDWDAPENPPYSYYLYHIYCRITRLNIARARRGLPAFMFRPECAKQGRTDSAAAAFLVAHHVQGGQRIHRLPALEYLFYLAQIGICTSNVHLQQKLDASETNAFWGYFRRSTAPSSEHRHSGWFSASSAGLLQRSWVRT